MGIFDGLKKSKAKKENLTFSDQWDIYLSQKEDLNYFIRFDTALANLTENEKKKYPHTIELRVSFVGKYDQSEMERLNIIEDNFNRGSNDIHFIGGLTDSSYRFFIFCCGGAADDVNGVIQTLMSANKGVAFSTEVFLNDNLSYYDKILAPNRYEKKWMRNRKVCDALERAGETFKKPRLIDFYCYFTSPQYIKDIADKTSAQGFKELAQRKSADGEYLLHLTLEDVPAFDRINDITNGILDLLDGTDGCFDGWGCPAHKDE